MYVAYICKWSSAHALWGVSGVASFITTSIKPRLLFSRAGYASWGLSLSSVQTCYQEFFTKVYFLLLVFKVIANLDLSQQ